MPYTGRNLNSIMSLSWIQMNLFRYITLIIKQDSQQATSQYKINFFLIRSYDDVAASKFPAPKHSTSCE